MTEYDIVIQICGCHVGAWPLNDMLCYPRVASFLPLVKFSLHKIFSMSNQGSAAPVTLAGIPASANSPVQPISAHLNAK